MKVEEAERFYGVQARVYDVTRRLTLPGRKRAIQVLGIRPGDRVIDFACGTGLNFPELRKYAPSEIVGVDVSQPMLVRAGRRDPAALLQRSDVARYRPDRKADRAICTYALSLLDSWEPALDAMRDSLTPDGALVILDFHPFLGALGLLNPLFLLWLSSFGVNARKPVGEALRLRFRRVDCRIPRWGYSAVWLAQSPLEFRMK